MSFERLVFGNVEKLVSGETPDGLATLGLDGRENLYISDNYRAVPKSSREQTEPEEESEVSL